MADILMSQRAQYISSQRYTPNNVTLKKRHILVPRAYDPSGRIVGSGDENENDRNRLHFMTGASLRLGPGINKIAGPGAG